MQPSHRLTCSDYYQHLLEPVPGDLPCGEAPDYDPDFIILQSRLQPKPGAEYGNFVEAAEPINWAEAERDALQLLQKSRDIRLIVILMRCRLRKTGLAALAEGTEALLALLHTWPNDLHPQLLDEGEFDPLPRANAVAELEDIHGLLTDLRHQPLPKSAGLQITVKEFEKAHQIPREEGALSDEAVSMLIQDWHSKAGTQFNGLIQAGHFLQEIKQVLVDTLGQEAPELTTLTHLLSLFTHTVSNPPPGSESTETVQPEPATEVVEDALPAEDASTDKETANFTVATPCLKGATEVHSRDDALRALQQVRSWFAIAEPSSPLGPLLRYAEDSIGKNFADLMKMYPPEIITLLSQHEE